MAGKIPVTVLTGFLGSGKTTLLNRILRENHGKRIAVIENEFGEVGVDQELVIGADEEIFEMNNGCICCTVRGDLIRVLGNLMKRRERFDYILIETTGLADPAPVAQTFFVDDEMQQRYQLDAIVTMVDAKHLSLHLDDSKEAREQIAFADVILLNKIDLVGEAELLQLEARIRGMNAAAKLYRTKDAVIGLDKILSIGGFDLGRALEVDPKFLEPEYPFEWGGVYLLGPGQHQLHFESGPDPEMSLSLRKASAPTLESLALITEEVALRFSDRVALWPLGEPLKAADKLYRVPLSGPTQVHLSIDEMGAYALFTQHQPSEFSLSLRRAGVEIKPEIERSFKPDHEHDDEISSVGITTDGEVDEAKFNAWIRTILTTQGADIFRMKGIIAIKGRPERFVFHGVHMLFNGQPDRLWGKEAPHNALIFIGRNLDRARLNEGFSSCLA